MNNRLHRVAELQGALQALEAGRALPRFFQLRRDDRGILGHKAFRLVREALRLRKAAAIKAARLELRRVVSRLS
ncbi:MAG: hypothetical protein D6812_09860 [Deltaproteobacteria bacterium]|nr:MAG: hypothetical protein D6812_09860 [Deltaproteobacteria bacterium]